jgi:hypothetical protein
MKSGAYSLTSKLRRRRHLTIIWRHIVLHTVEPADPKSEVPAADGRRGWLVWDSRRGGGLSLSDKRTPPARDGALEIFLGLASCP